MQNLKGSVRIIGVGESTPMPHEMKTNDDVLENLRKNGFDIGDKTGLDTEKLVGVQTRWWSNLTSGEQALIAAKNACIDAVQRTNGGFNQELVRLIHSGGSSSDDSFPACASGLQDFLGIPNRVCEVRDIGGLACSSFVDAITVANSRMRQKEIRYGLVALGECIGTRMNPPTSWNHTLWGDGGAAVVLEYDPHGDPNFGILDDLNISDAGVDEENPKGDHKFLWTRSRKLGLHPDHDQYGQPEASMEDHAADIHRWGINYGSEALSNFVGEEMQVPWVIIHSSNLRLATKMGKKVGFPEGRILTCTKDRGNPSSVAVGVELARRVARGTFRSGDLIYLVAFGAGMAFVAVKLRWG